MIFFLFIFSIFCSFTSLTSSAVIFIPASNSEILSIQNHMISFYGQGLVEAGLFIDETSALHAAEREILEGEKDVSRYFFTLTLEGCKESRFGYLVYSIDSETAYIEAVYLDEQVRRQGLGKTTLQHLEKKLRNMKIHSIRLYVFAHNQTAFNLYKKLGYSTENCYFRDEIPVGYHMKKIL